jgi:hypothetical protein
MHAVLLADKTICLWLHRIQMKIRWDVMKILIGDDIEVLAGRNTGEDASGGSMSNI